MNRRAWKAAGWLLAAIMIVLGQPAAAVVGQTPAAPGAAEGILVRFKAGVTDAEKARVLGAAGCTEARRFRLVRGLALARPRPGMAAATAMARLRASGAVAYAEPNYIVTAAAIPNDPRFPELYGLDNTGQTGGTPDADIDAPEAWDVQTGSDVVVAVIDTGLDYNHEDIVGNVWTNPGEIPNNGIDDDNNGYVDDVMGWDFVNGDNDPFDDNDHGTHVSGTIAAVGNNAVGVAGVNWSARIMPLKFLSARGSGTTADAISALEYAVMMGARISNNSWGGGAFSQALYDAILAAQNAGHLFVAAAGNDGVDTDVTPSYPASYDLDNIVSVAATDDNDALATFSNFGAVTVDLGAPGVSILSTTPANTYSSFSGTSMATPHVAGTAALLLAEDPGLDLVSLKAAIMEGVDPVPALAGITVTGGRLNAAGALARLVRVVVTPAEATLAAGTTLQFNATGGTAPYTWSVSDTTVATIDATGLLTALAPGQVTVTATDANGLAGTASVTVTTVVVSPDTAVLQVGDTLQFTATGGAAPYTWSVSDTTVATIDAATGLLTAVAPGTVVVTATDADGISGSSGVITVTDNHVISITPYTATVGRFGTIQFTADGGVGPYTWSLTNPRAGTIDPQTGLFRAGRFPTTTTVIATDADGHSGESGTITVTRGRH